jgi:hypothetical protein
VSDAGTLHDPSGDQPSDPLDDVSDGRGESRRRRGLTPRRLFQIVAVVLLLVLAALIAYLLWFLGRPEGLGDRPERSGIQPIWEVYGPAEGERPLFDRPMGVAIDERNRVYVTDSGNNRVCVFDSAGRFLLEFGSFGIAKPGPGVSATYQPGSLNYPVGIDVDDEGNVYVASFRNDSIEVYDLEGRPLRRFPEPTAITGNGGSGQDGLGIAVTDVEVYQDRVYATDTYQIVVFSRAGELLDQWGKPGTGPGDLDHPNGLAVGDDGTVYVSDSNHARITAFTPEGEVLWQVGRIPAGIADHAVRDVELPRGLAVLPDDSLLAVDAFSFQLVRISAEGVVVGRYGERGVEPGQMNFPNDVERLRSYIVIADKENGRLQLVRLVD